MATGTVKTFSAERKYGFLTGEDGEDVYVHADCIKGGALTPGDIVEFEIAQTDGDAAAIDVTVVRPARPSNPVGRTLAQPPNWDILEERDRQRRAARRRRR